MARKRRSRNHGRRLIGLAAFVVIAVCLFKLLGNPAHQPVLSNLSVVRWTPVIDAGHGGEDGGAVSPEGDHESALNLAIAQKAELILRFYGITPVMTRTEDVSIHDASAKTLSEKKNSDLRNRVKLVNAMENAVLLSIHQNTFEQSQYFGAQALYNKNTGSRALAEQMQDVICGRLDPSNTRKARQIEDTIILMRDVNCPAVLLECGFLTNAAELRKLKSDEYQTAMAAAAVSSFLTWAAAS